MYHKKAFSALFTMATCIGLLLVSGCTSPFKPTKDSVDKTHVVQVLQNQSNSSQFFITPTTPIAHLTDLDFNNPDHVTFAQELVTSAIELSHSHANADFSMHIAHKNGLLTTMVSLRPASSPPSQYSCPFCPPRQLKGAIIDETANTIAFEKSTPPRDPINFLIVPKKHIINYKDPSFTPQIFINQLVMAKKRALHLTNPTSVDLYVNNGANASQTIFHSHMHFHSTSEWKK